MSDFDTFESSLEASRPLEVYEIAQGSSTTRFTSNGSDVTLNGNVYSAIAISRGAVALSTRDRSRSFEVTVPSSLEFVQQYVSNAPGPIATLNVIRLQRDESPAFNTQVLVFKGVVKTVKFSEDGRVAIIVCQTIESAASRQIPRFTYMSQCNHTLFDPGCGLDSGLFSHTGLVSAVSGNDVTVTGLNASGFDITGGVLQIPSQPGEFRLVLSQSSDTVTLLLPFPSDPTGDNAVAFAGCDHVITSDCALVFDNVERYGGFAFVPNRNPFMSGLD